jgi:hypothetical protein
MRKTIEAEGELSVSEVLEADIRANKERLIGERFRELQGEFCSVRKAPDLTQRNAIRAVKLLAQMYVDGDEHASQVKKFLLSAVENYEVSLNPGLVMHYKNELVKMDEKRHQAPAIYP